MEMKWFKYQITLNVLLSKVKSNILYIFNSLFKFFNKNSNKKKISFK